MNLVDFSSIPMWGIIAIFLVSAAVVTAAGTRMTRLADRLADLTGLGEAVFGAVFLGACTSLAGIVTSLVTAHGGYPELAISNAVGNIAAQTTILAIADLVYRRANLEHAAASMGNLMQGALLIVLLAIPILAMSAPSYALLGVNPFSLLLLAAYGYGLHLTRRAQEEGNWEPQQTDETLEDEPDEPASDAPPWRAGLMFTVYAVIIAVTGYVLAKSAMVLADRTGLSQTVIGGLFTAVITAAPELVTTVAAVRARALTLAVGGIIGGNTFDIMVVSLADIAYRDGSIYHAISDQQLFFVGLTLLLNGILLLGLLRREKSGIANIGFESFLMLVLYAGAIVLLFFSNGEQGGEQAGEPRVSAMVVTGRPAEAPFVLSRS